MLIRWQTPAALAAKAAAAVALLLIPGVPGLQAIEPIDGDPACAARELIAREATPLFAVSNLAIYEVSFASLAARLSVAFEEDRVRGFVISFDARERTQELRRDADRVLKRLRVLYGPPASVSRASGQFKTHVWADGPRILVHTVVFSPGLERHFIEADAGFARE